MFSRRKFIKLTVGLISAILTGVALPVKLSNDERVKLSSNNNAANKVAHPQQAEVIAKSALDDIKTLAAPAMQGRQAGTIGEERAAAYITSQLQALELVPIGGTGYEMVFTIPPVDKRVVNGRLTFCAGDQADLRSPSFNLVGKRAGTNSDEVVLISAHYDHLGIFQNRVYPGANDNASGVGCVLDVLRRLIKEKAVTRATIVAAFWSAEEMGFIGSRAFVEQPPFPLNRIKAVVNVDTVGNGVPGEFAYWSSDTNAAVEALEAAGKQAGVNLSQAAFYGHNSDQSSFAVQGIPAVTLLSREWLADNHSPNDTPEIIEPSQVRLASDVVYRTVRLLAK